MMKTSSRNGARVLRAALSVATALCFSTALGGCNRAAKPPVAAPKFKTLAQKNYYELWKATRDDDLSALQKLVKTDPKLAKVNGSFGTPLHMAMNNRADAELCRYLLKQGADPNAYDSQGKTPLLIAVRGMSRARKTRVVESLLAGGANVNAANKTNGATALSSAVVVGDLDVVKLLLKAGANPNLATKKGQTPLQQVVKSQNDLKTNAPTASLLAKFTNSENFPAIEQLLRQAGGK